MAKKKQRSGKNNAKMEVKDMEKVEQRDTVILEDAININKEELMTKEESIQKQDKQDKVPSKVKTKEKIIPLEIKGKRVIKFVIGAVNITSSVIIPTEEIPVASTNIIEVPLDKPYKDVKLLPPADIKYELVSYYNGVLKIRPRINTILKDKEIKLLVTAS